MKYYRILLFSLLYFFLIGAMAFGQSSSIKEGDRIKVNAPTIAYKPIVGQVTEISPSLIVIKTKRNTYKIPKGSIREVAVSTGRKRNGGKGLAIGAGAGFVAFGIIGLATHQPCDREGIYNIAPCFSAGEAALLIGTGGAIIGGIVGLITGLSSESDRWEKVPVNISLNSLPLGQDRIAPFIRWNIPLRFGENHPN